MARRGFLIGHLDTIPVEIDGSWILIFIFLTWSLATSYFPSVFTHWSTVEFWLVGGITSLVFFFCVLLHEIGHSLVAMHYQIPVRKITLFIFGGASEISEEPSNAKVEFWVAISGPLVSLALGALFFLLGVLFNKVSPLLAFTQYLAFINITLAALTWSRVFPWTGAGSSNRSGGVYPTISARPPRLPFSLARSLPPYSLFSAFCWCSPGVFSTVCGSL